MPLDDNHPPPYESDFDVCLPLPLYSRSLGNSECLLRPEQPDMIRDPIRDWVFETKHMKINLGPRIWGLRSPTYGLHSRAEGSVQFLGCQNRIERVTVTLVGYLAITFAHISRFSGGSTQLIMSDTLELYNKCHNDFSRCDRGHFFSLSIPSVINIRGKMMPTPPSFSFHQHITCKIFYALRFCMKRKRKGITKDETKTIELFYLPKSSPPDPPVLAIPRIPRRSDDRTSLLSLYTRIKTVPLLPCRPTFCKIKSSSKSFHDVIHLSLPSPLCFTSGELIPFTVALVFPDEPVLASLFSHNTQIQLLKRLIIHRKYEEPFQRDMLVSSAQLHTYKEYSEGVYILRGTIQAGTAGGETSWHVENIAEIQYVLRAILRTPHGLVDHVPSFWCEETLQITTDYWGVPNRELNSVGGPIPALGLAKSLTWL